MEFNTSSEFVGINALKQMHGKQIIEFEVWASNNDWERFHYSHYDWWVFPVNRRSSYGLKYVVYDGEIAELKKDMNFFSAYHKGVQLVAASWGWDLMNKTYISNPCSGQSWHQWPVRLYKAAQSVQLFGENELFDSLNIFAHLLIDQGQSMEYNGKDLSWIFKPL